MAELAHKVAEGMAGSGGRLRTPSEASRAPRQAPGLLLPPPLAGGGGPSGREGVGAERSIRAALARELHDRVAQPLTTLLMDLEEFKHSPGDRRRRVQRIGAFQRQAREVLYEIRDVLCDLRDQEGRDRGFVTRLRGELESRAMRHPHLDIRLVVSPQWPGVIRARCSDHLLQIVLEAFHNARLHGGAARIVVALRAGAGGRAEVSVADDGRGLCELEAPLRPGLGLIGMHERATLLGGRLVVGARTGGGTRIRVTFPREVLG
jgi:signal transduction histidine kinase